MERLARNRAGVWERIRRASRACGRDPAGIRLVCVTKSVSPELAAALNRTGESDLGENRIEALEHKAAYFEQHGLEVRWHWLAHVQRRKARRIVRLASEIHSLDSIELLEQLVRLAAEEGRSPGLYVQVRLAHEDSKTGIDMEGARVLTERAAASPLPLLGLMGMAPNPASEDERAPLARAAFERLSAFARELPADRFVAGRPALSMGMSADLEAAINAGADVVRVGSALFVGVEHEPSGQGGGAG